MLTIGIDDAGRGPVLGSMFLAGVLVDENGKQALKTAGVKESKQAIQSTRVKWAEIIKQSSRGYYVVKSSPQQIDDAILSGKNLNTLEAMKTAEIINNLNTGKDEIKVIVDCPSVNTVAWRKTLLGYIQNPDNLDVHCEHKADVNHIEAAAASILAKVAREEEVEKLKKEYGKIGSGYPSDPDTKEFLKKNGTKLENSGIFRKSWATWKALFATDKQKTLF